MSTIWSSPGIFCSEVGSKEAWSSQWDMCFMWFFFLFKRTGCQSMLSEGHSFLGHLLPVLRSCEGFLCEWRRAGQPRKPAVSRGHSWWVSLLDSVTTPTPCHCTGTSASASGQSTQEMTISCFESYWKERWGNEPSIWQSRLSDKLNFLTPEKAE